jgi:hypothetical protein
MTTKLRGRIMGARFKTFSGAAKRADAERFFHPGYCFTVEDEKDPYHRANGKVYCIRKTKLKGAGTTKLVPLERNPWLKVH